MMKKLSWLVGSVLVLSITLTAAWLNSAAGTQWFFQQLSHVVPQLRIQQVQGHLGQGFCLRQLQFDNGQVAISAERVQVQWQPLALLRWQVRILAVQVSHLSVKTRSSHSDAGPMPVLSALKWPWYWPSVVVQRIQSQQAELDLSGHRLGWQQWQMALRFNRSALLWLSTCWRGYYDDSPAINLSWRVYGPWQHYQVAIQSQTAAANVTVAGIGSRQQVELNRVFGANWPLGNSFSLAFTWWPQLQVKGQVQLHDFDLSTWLPAWPSRVNLEARGQVNVDSAQWQATSGQLLVQRGDGQVRHKAFHVQGQFDWQPGQWRIDQAVLQSGQATVQANGVLQAGHHALTWHIAIPDLEDLWPQAQGSIHSQGSIQGSTWQGHVEAQHIRYQTLRVDQALSDFVFRAPQTFHLTLTGRQWHWQTQQLTLVQVASGGVAQQQQLSWSIVAPSWRTSGQWQGGFDEQQVWRGQWQGLWWQHAGQAPWRLAEAVPMQWSLHHIQLAQPLCVQQSQQRVCAQVQWQANQAWTIGFQTQRVQLADWAWALPDSWRMRGTLNSEFQAAGQQDHVQSGHWRVEAKALNLTYHDRQNLWPIDLGQLDSRGLIKAEQSQVSFDLNGALGHWWSQASWLGSFGTLEHWQRLPMQGALQGEIKDLKSLNPWLSTIGKAQGGLLTRLTWHGSLLQPQADLVMQTRNASLFLPDYNIVLNPLVLNLSGNPAQQLTLTGQAQSGPGTVQLKGQIDQLWSKPRFSVNVSGENFLAVNLATYRIFASPQLQLTYQAPQMQLTGQVRIPQASLRFVDYQKQVVKLSSDVVYVNADATDFRFVSQLQVILGNKVSLQYGGLKGRLIGQVTLNEQPNRPTSGLGQIQLTEATYQAYGKTFIIREGKAQFTGGEVTNPIVAMQAVRELTDVVPVTQTGSVLSNSPIAGVNEKLTVGVSMNGPLKTAEIKLFSVPAGLSSADILSYLVLGRPASEAGGSGAQLLMNAASLLGSSSGSGPIVRLQQQLKNTLGLEVDVGATSQFSKENQSVTQNTSVILGKALSPRLFLNYSIGIAQPVNVLRLTYKISPNWSAQTESSSLGNGGDLFYTINRQ